MIADFRIAVTTISLLSVTFGVCRGQDPEPTSPGDSESRLSASLGLNDFHLKDEYLAPEIIRGNIFASRLSLDFSSAVDVHAIDATFSHGSPASHYQERQITQNIGSLSYSYLHAVDTWEIAGLPLKFLLGGGVSSFVANTDYNAYDTPTSSKSYDQAWYWSHALDLHAEADVRLAERSTITVRLTTPLVRLVSRPENGHYLSSANQKVYENFFRAFSRGKPEFAWENLVLMGEVRYSNRWSDRFGIHGSYIFGYAATDRPLEMAMYSNQVLVGADWYF